MLLQLERDLDAYGIIILTPLAFFEIVVIIILSNFGKFAKLAKFAN